MTIASGSASDAAPHNSGEEVVLDMGDLLDWGLDEQYPAAGEVATGTVIAIETDRVYVLIESDGVQLEGVVDHREMRSLGPDAPSRLEINDRIEVCVLEPNGDDGLARLSIDSVRAGRGWEQILRHLENKEVIEAEITGANRGGLLARVEGVNAFIPWSKVIGPRPSGDRIDHTLVGIGRTVSVKVIGINEERKEATLSERDGNRELIEAQRQRLFDELTVGEVRRGRVASVTDFGVFFDLGGADALAHASELAWGFRGDPRSLFSAGQETDVLVTRVDHENRRIAVSVRRASRAEWEARLGSLKTGNIVPAVVTKVVKFGAFACVPGQLEGFIHISELAYRRLESPEEIVAADDVIPVRVEWIAHDEMKLALSLLNARNEAENRGWEFDASERVTRIGDEALDEFPAESAAAEKRYRGRATEAERIATRPDQQPQHRRERSEPTAMGAALQAAGVLGTGQ